MNHAMLGMAAMLTLVASAPAGDVGFIEDFALSKDRAATLRQLIPGTEEFYYYHCLHALNNEQFERIAQYTGPWHERFGQTGLLTEIQTRHALLIYDRDPKKALQYVRDRLGLRFDHQREVLGAAPNLPTALDPKSISRDVLRTHSLNNWSGLDNFEDAALDWLAGVELNWERRRSLLQRLQRPDLANLPRLVDEDLKSPHAQGFGAYPIHRQMTLSQLAELLRLRPELLNQPNFVQTWLMKLQPGADDDWRRDRRLLVAYLDRLQAFVERLAPAHNALKAHVLYHRLVFDRSQGTFDRNRFMAYIKLPRQQPYMAKTLLESDQARRYPADLNVDFNAVTMFPIVGFDEDLVRSYLKHFFAEASSYREFEPYINELYLKHLFAETKVELGLGDPEQWASQLPPEQFKQLKERIDIDFAHTNKTDFAADEPVKLDLFVKNVPSLIVKVFEINTQNVYRTTQREIDTDINLDGLVANSEKVHPYTEAPLRRIARSFEFAELTKPGVYVIDFIGSGKSSRALIRKGRLRPLVATGTAGQVVHVVDDANKPVKDATVWLGGQEYRPEADGAIIVPFSTSPGRRPIVISRGEFSSLDTIGHAAEGLELRAGIYVDREALLTSRVASILIRPGVFLNGQPVSIKLLEEVKLRIASTDQGGIVSTTEVPDFKLFEDREAIHEVRVPPRLASLTVTLEGKFKILSRGQTVAQAASQTFTLNGIDKTDKIEDLHFARFGGDYVIEVLGRTGEAKADRPVQLAIKHRDFKEPVNATLKTDGQGRIKLGVLPDILSVTATGPEGVAHTWSLPTDKHTYRQVVNAKAGEAVTVPYLGAAGQPSRDELAFFEVRGSLIRADKFDALAVKDGLIEMRNLAPGDYDLWLKRSGERIRVRVVEGPRESGYVLGTIRHMELAGLKPVQIQSIGADAEFVTVKLTDASKFARVHVFATRYRPEYSAFANLGRVRDAELGGVFPARNTSVFLTGRNIGDEYRYVLDRRNQKKFAGNMLDRPMLLLNPWAVRSTEAGEQQAEGGEGFGSGGVPAPSAPAAKPESAADPRQAAPSGNFANLDFLSDATAVLVNLVPDKDGLVRIPRAKVGPHSMIHVVAVDPLATTTRSITLPEQPAKFLDLRLAKGLDPSKHFTQQKTVSVLAPNQPFVLDDVVGSRFEAYDSLPKIYGLFTTLSKDAKLAEFAFIMDWPKLKPEDKRKQYSKYACHELNFFLSKRDPAFFKEAVRPYLANKKDKTFLDHFLLDDDIAGYRAPWEFGRLNTVERVLLAQRLAGEPQKTARHLNELFRVLPPNSERLLVLFDTAVKGGDLGTADEWGYKKAKETNAPLRVLEAGAAGAPQGGAGVPPGTPPAEAKSGVLGNFQNGGRFVAGLTPADKDVALSRDGRSQRAGGQDRKSVESLAERATSDVQRGTEFFYREDRTGKFVRQLYRRIEATQEWAENNYYHLPIAQQLAALVGVNPFWLDYAKHDSARPFFSKNFADASHNFTEIMFALSVLDLPFDAGKHVVKFEGNKMTMTPAGPVIAFHEEVRPAGPATGHAPILISQNFYRYGDRYREENGEKLDKFVTGEFVVHTVYGCEVVVTNPSSARQKLSVLVQLPIGALPLNNGQFTRSVQLDLEPYRTQTVDYLFYFPQPGHFAHFPVNVAKNEQFLAAAPATVFDVVAKPSKLDTTSWEYVSQNGSTEDVLAFLGRENVNALNLDKIAFRMSDRTVFEAVVRLLQDRHMYQPTIWSYGILHGDVPVARQFLLHADQFVAECGGPIVSPLLTIDPVARYQYEHLEYKPLVNARAHSLGQRRQIVNARLNEQYHRTLKLLSYHNRLDDTDRLAVVYYLLLQDRTEEALSAFATVNPEKVTTKLQYDYCAAWLDMVGDAPQKARSVAMKYANHPVDRWRNAFATITNQLDEAEGKNAQMADADNRDQRQGQLASTEPGFEFNLDAQKINLTWQNVEQVRINYYLMDVELLFSRNPFVQQSGGQFASIRPNDTRLVALPAGQSKSSIPLPDEFVRRNVLVEVTAAGKSRALPYYATAMEVKLTENYGQLKAADAAGKPLSKVYVKVYARLANGEVKFHKDGYTDLRGRFDYATVSTPEKQPIDRYSILVLSEERGATIREAAPPQQ